MFGKVDQQIIMAGAERAQQCEFRGAQPRCAAAISSRV